MNKTIEKEENKKLPQLVKGSSTYRLIVPAKVEEKIRYLIRKFPHTEWSGVLFCSHKGTFENNDLVITCEDIFPMDLGTSGWTEFKMSEDVAAYMAENVELFDCSIQLIHSHHSLGAFLSGQDMKMVAQEGNDTNCFVSLVVDTKGTYVAVVTRKIQTKSEVTIKNLGKSYEFFGDGTKELTHDNVETTKVIDKEIIEYFDLEVERHEVSNTLEYLDDRFDEIEKKKQSERKYLAKSPNSAFNTHYANSFFDSKGETSKEIDLFSKEEAQRKPSTLKDKEKPYRHECDWMPDLNEIHKAVVHILTCNLILNTEKIDLRQWVMRHMATVYKKVFGEQSIDEARNECSGAFAEYRDFIVQFTISYFHYDGISDDEMDTYFDVFQSRVAQAMMDEIYEYMDVNPYIKSYYDTLAMFIVE